MPRRRPRRHRHGCRTMTRDFLTHALAGFALALLWYALWIVTP